MKKFKFWYFKNRTKITWFIIGWLALNSLDELAKGNYISMLISLGLIWVNVSMQ